MKPFVLGLLALVALPLTAATAFTRTEPAPVSGPPYELEVTRDVRYGEDRDGFHPALLDVYAPAAGRDWPTVMMFHGGGGQASDKGNVELMARVVAAQGAVVFAPNVGGASADPNSRDFRILTDPAAACATSFALTQSVAHGGDPTRLTLTGFSGGANAAAAVALAEQAASAAFCAVTPELVEPDALVLWEGDYVLAPWWDNALEQHPTFYRDEWLWGRLDHAPPADWHIMLGDPERAASDRLPIGDPFGSGDSCGRPLDGEPGIVPTTGTMCRFFDLRDPTEELRRTADRLGLFDDGWFSIGDFSLLFADRLAASGNTSTLSMVPDATHGNLTAAGAMSFAELVIDGPAGVCDGWVATMVGSAGDDVLRGTAGRDVIDAREGDDTVQAVSGNDLVCAGPGDDTVFTGIGDDVAHGQGGEDRLFGGEGSDELHGGRGQDLEIGGPGSDLLAGGRFSDRLIGGSGPDRLFGGRGFDVLLGGLGEDELRGGRGNDEASGGLDADLIAGFFGSDDLVGGGGHDLIFGGRGNDQLAGSAGDDTLAGEGGDDGLDGGIGVDACDGGPGSNTLRRCEIPG